MIYARDRASLGTIRTIALGRRLCHQHGAEPILLHIFVVRRQFRNTHNTKAENDVIEGFGRVCEDERSIEDCARPPNSEFQKTEKLAS